MKDKQGRFGTLWCRYNCKTSNTYIFKRDFLGDIVALDDVSFSYWWRMHGIIGHTGSGKSTPSAYERIAEAHLGEIIVSDMNIGDGPVKKVGYKQKAS